MRFTPEYDDLVVSPEQDERMLRALAVCIAKQAALRAGASGAELDAKTWAIHVRRLDPEVIPGAPSARSDCGIQGRRFEAAPLRSSA